MLKTLKNYSDLHGKVLSALDWKRVGGDQKKGYINYTSLTSSIGSSESQDICFKGVKCQAFSRDKLSLHAPHIIYTILLV
jgi:hypothetical protein